MTDKPTHVRVVVRAMMTIVLPLMKEPLPGRLHAVGMEPR